MRFQSWRKEKNHNLRSKSLRGAALFKNSIKSYFTVPLKTDFFQSDKNGLPDQLNFREKILKYQLSSSNIQILSCYSVAFSKVENKS